MALEVRPSQTRLDFRVDDGGEEDKSALEVSVLEPSLADLQTTGENVINEFAGDFIVYKTE